MKVLWSTTIFLWSIKKNLDSKSIFHKFPSFFFWFFSIIKKSRKTCIQLSTSDLSRCEDPIYLLPEIVCADSKTKQKAYHIEKLKHYSLRSESKLLEICMSSVNCVIKKVTFHRNVNVDDLWTNKRLKKKRRANR